MNIQTFSPKHYPTDFDYLTPTQTHGANIVEIKTGTEDLSDCDGLWSRNNQFALGVKTADCAPISFYNETLFGVIHAGWRGCINGIIEHMLDIIKTESDLETTKFFVGPILPVFEIQKDDCYQAIKAKFGDQFFQEDGDRVYFNFKSCLKTLIPSAEFDERVTLNHDELVSWRGQKTTERNLTLINGPK